MYTINTKYSEQEYRLFKELGYASHLDFYDSPVGLYRDVAVDMFIKNASGPAIEALRRGVDAIHKCTPYRMTPKFNELISF